MNACDCGSCTCGCCEGLRVDTPVRTFNRPGLSALAYRVGTHARFVRSMKARLSSRDYPALRGLRTREEDDFSVALLDGWATVADVLTFYQERLAAEGFLRTATERRSVLELARLIGYAPRPGVAASVHLAYTLDPGQELTIPMGSRVQSVPDPGEKPQVFETSEELEARAELSVLRPRLTRPQYLTRTLLNQRRRVYLEGVTTDVKVDGKLLLWFADGKSSLHEAAAVIPDAAGERTRVDLRPVLLASRSWNGEDEPENPTLATIVDELRKPASLQPRSARRLERSVSDLYTERSDLVPRLYGALYPEIPSRLYSVLKAVVPSPVPDPQLKGEPAFLTSVDTLRTRAALFGHNLPRTVTVSKGESQYGPLPDLQNTWHLPDDPTSLSVIYLDADYTGIQSGSRVAVRRPYVFSVPFLEKARGKWTYGFHEVLDVASVNVRAHNVSMRVTRLTLDSPWLKESSDEKWGDLISSEELLRSTTVLARSEELPLAEEPIPGAVEGEVVELEGLHRGLEPGRFVIVEGERADLWTSDRDLDRTGETANPGVVDAELAMVAQVEHRVAPDSDDSTTPPGETLHTFIRFAAPLEYRFRRQTVKIHANVVEATHGETKVEVLGNGDATVPLQSFSIKQPPLTYVAAPTARGAESTLEVRVNEVKWHESDHPAGLGPTDRRYTLRTDDDGETSVVFGDGERGARLPTGVENVSARYRRGIGRDGNVGARKITLLLDKPLGLKEVVNPSRAAGGADRETRNQARRNAPVATRALDRLVSVRDYEDFARAFAGIGKASAVELSDGARHFVHVTVAGANDAPITPSSDLFENLARALRDLGDPHLLVELEARELLLLVVEAGIRVLPDYHWDDVEPRARARMLEAFGFESRELGQDVLRAEVLGELQGVRGVEYVDLDTLAALGDTNLATIDTAEFEKESRLHVRLAEFGREEGQEPLPERSPVVPAQIAVLSPEVADTLILSELK